MDGDSGEESVLSRQQLCMGEVGGYAGGDKTGFVGQEVDAWGGGHVVYV